MRESDPAQEPLAKVREALEANVHVNAHEDCGCPGCKASAALASLASLEQVPAFVIKTFTDRVFCAYTDELSARDIVAQAPTNMKRTMVKGTILVPKEGGPAR